MGVLGVRAVAVAVAAMLSGCTASGCTATVFEPDDGPSPSATPLPHPSTPAPATPASPTASEQPTKPAPTLRQHRRYVFPVRGGAAYVDDHHDYPATDLFADCGTPVVAPASGIVLEASRRDRWDASVNAARLRGGLFWSIAGDDGVRYYGSHLSTLANAVRPGAWVRAGQRLGRVGMTGNAAGIACHLHFGISPSCAETGDWWVRRGVVAPYPYLRAWEKDRDRSPARETRGWQQRQSCPERPGAP